MRATDDSTRILRTAAWIWLGFLLAMALMDFALYTPKIQQLLGENLRFPTGLPNQPLLPNPGANNPAQPLRLNLFPVYLFYSANGLTALLFLLFNYWEDIRAGSRGMEISIRSSCLF